MTDLERRKVFDRAADQFTDTVYRLAVHHCPTRPDAEDVTQEVFETLFQSRKEFAGDEHMKAWLIRVTLNRCKNLCRAHRWDSAPLPEDLPAPATQPSVLEEVRALPEHFRSAIYLHYFEGYTAAEIGGLMGANVNTVLSWLSRGRQALKKRMIGGFEDE